MSSTGSYYPKAQAYHSAWRKWELIWSWANGILGVLSTGLGALVAANVKIPFLTSAWSVGIAVSVPILTLLLTTLKPQAQAAGLKLAGRELEKALASYEAAETKNDVCLGDRDYLRSPQREMTLNGMFKGLSCCGARLAEAQAEPN